MRAALALLGQVPARRLGRRIAVLGDMLELGPEGAALHAALAEAVRANAVDLVFCAGPLMKSLWDALPSERRGGYAETSAALEPLVLGAIHSDDAVMVKGSLGSRMGPIVKALKRRYAPSEPAQALKVEPMLYWLADFSGTISAVQRVPLPHGAHRRLDDDRVWCSSFCSGRGSSITCACARARASRSARTVRSRIS